METLTPTFKIAARVYWSMFWCYIVFGMLPGFVIGAVMGFAIGIVGYVSGFDKTTIMGINVCLNMMIGLAWGITVSIFIIKHLLDKQYKTFRIAILPVDTV
jgi:MFS family permease